MSLVTFAETELDRIGMTADSAEPMNLAMRNHILAMVRVFADEGHSGMSAEYAAEVLAKLLRQEPLTPLTGEDGEWVDVSTFAEHEPAGKLFQNKRCSRVFKDDSGVAWDVDAEVFVYNDGFATGGNKRIEVTFPYMPTTRYVNVEEFDEFN